jgi:hypothetical protein
LLLRSKEGLALLQESQKRRFKSTDLIDKCVELDTTWKESKLFNYLKFRKRKI